MNLDIERHIGLIGGIASIVGAIVAFWQSGKALKAKKETEIIRDKINKKYLDYELSHLRPKIGFVVNQLTKHTKINSSVSRKGLRLEDDIHRLKELINEIRSNNIYSNSDVKSNLDSITEQLKNADEELKLDEIIIYLTHISREFDKNIKKDN